VEEDYNLDNHLEREEVHSYRSHRIAAVVDVVGAGKGSIIIKSFIKCSIKRDILTTYAY
jgi:hypothetical protein